MAIVVALDIATTTGFAVYRNGEYISGSVKFAPGEHPGQRPARLRAWLTEQKYKHGDIDFIVFEDAFNQKGQAATVFQRFVGVLMAWAYHHQIGVMGVPVSTLKKFATSYGAATKEQMVEAARNAGFRVDSHDEADAINLLRYTLSTNPQLLRRATA